MHDRINKLSITLLGEPLKEQKGKRVSERNVVIRSPSKLVYKGPSDRGPTEVQWMVGFLSRIFNGREITTNACEGTFGNMGTLIRSGRSIVLERALTKSMLASGDMEETARWFMMCSLYYLDTYKREYIEIRRYKGKSRWGFADLLHTPRGKGDAHA